MINIVQVADVLLNHIMEKKYAQNVAFHVQDVGTKKAYLENIVGIVKNIVEIVSIVEKYFFKMKYIAQIVSIEFIEECNKLYSYLLLVKKNLIILFRAFF